MYCQHRILQVVNEWSRMSCMSGYFEKKFKEMMDRLGTSAYKVSLSIAADPARIDKILFMRRPTTFDKRLETLQEIAKSPLLDIDFDTMAGWLARDYLSEEALRSVMDDIDRHGPDVIQKIAEETLAKRKEAKTKGNHK